MVRRSTSLFVSCLFAACVACVAFVTTAMPARAATGGDVLAFGSAPALGSPAGQPLKAPIVGMAATPTGKGYWLVASDGGIFAYGDAQFLGSTGAIRLNRPIVGMASTATGKGYWLVASDGGIFAYGDAMFYGSTGAMTLNRPIVGMAATPTAHGYWLVASDGGIFSYGDAMFYGSTGAMTLNRPIVGMAATPTAHGYWLVASDGGIFAYGDATFYGSTGSIRLNSPITAMAGAPSGKGYWLVATDGGIFGYGDASFYGSGGGRQLAQPVVGIVAAPDGKGYWLPEGQRGLAGQVVAIDPGHNGANGAHPDVINRLVDIGNGTKACDTTGTATNDGYPEHAYTFDVATRAAALLRAGGATVVLTRPDDAGVGPCIDERAGIGNRAGAAVAVSIHADGGPAGGRGFHVIQPASIGRNAAIVAPSSRFATILRDTYRAETGMPVSTYIGSNGLDTRNDLGGLNLSTVPKVFIETGNMRNSTDAGLLEDPGFRQRAAQAIADAITAYLA